MIAYFEDDSKISLSFSNKNIKDKLTYGLYYYKNGIAIDLVLDSKDLPKNFFICKDCGNLNSYNENDKNIDFYGHVILLYDFNIYDGCNCNTKDMTNLNSYETDHLRYNGNLSGILGFKYQKDFFNIDDLYFTIEDDNLFNCKSAYYKKCKRIHDISKYSHIVDCCDDTLDVYAIKITLEDNSSLQFIAYKPQSVKDSVITYNKFGKKKLLD
jgi:hypothetical protein